MLCNMSFRNISTRRKSSPLKRKRSFLLRCLGKHQAPEIHYEIAELDDFCFTRLRVEWRDDNVCPFCAFPATSRDKLLKHLPRFHGDHHSFQITTETEPEMTKVVARPTQAYRDQSKTEINGQVPQEPTLEDFQFIRYSNRSCKQKRIRVDLSTDEEFGSATTIIDDSTTQEGPRLQYYHSRSRLPMRVGDWDIDSDDESDNEWIDQWAQGGLREYLDIKDDEKRVMDLWNRHMRSDSYVPDKQFLERIKAFMRNHFNEMQRQQIIMLLIIFTEHRLISPTQIKECMEVYDEIKVE